MLDRIGSSTLEIAPVQSAAPAERNFDIIRGRQFDGRGWHPSLTERTLLAADLASGKVAVQHFMVKQAAMMTGAHPVYILAVLHATAAERTALQRGEVSISSLASGRHKSFPETGRCSICSGAYDRFGHNPEPLMHFQARCCTVCNEQLVVPARLLQLEAARAAAG
jgi:hypothetical protein